MPKPTFQYGAPQKFLMDFQSMYGPGKGDIPSPLSYSEDPAELEYMMELLRRMLSKDSRYPPDVLASFEKAIATKGGSGTGGAKTRKLG